MQIEFTVQTWREGNQFIAHAMPLDVASAGPTPAAARAALDEAVGLFLRTAEEHGLGSRDRKAATAPTSRRVCRVRS
jgi:predicted RNase H-like HicB family nuclease